MKKEKNLGGRPKAFIDDVCIVLPMSVPSKQKDNLRKKWLKDLEEFRIKKNEQIPNSQFQM